MGWSGPIRQPERLSLGPEHVPLSASAMSDHNERTVEVHQISDHHRVRPVHFSPVLIKESSSLLPLYTYRILSATVYDELLLVLLLKRLMTETR